MLEFFKKKPVESEIPPEPATPEPTMEKQVKVDNIAIHAMPERFRNQPIKMDNAKLTGLAIIGGGVVFLIGASVLMYVYFFRAPAVTVKTEPTAVEQSQPAEQPTIDQNAVNTASPNVATSTEPATLPTDNSLATTTASTTPETVEQSIAVGLKPGLDSDNDGLTDSEEALLGTSTSTPDTDGDSYLDGAEILNLYDPASSGKLTANPNIALYENKTFNYSLLYPKAWQQSSNGGDDSVMFKSADNQFIQIIIQPNSGKQTLDQWYLEQVGGGPIDPVNRLSGSNWQGIKNTDGLTLYLMDNKQKYIFTLTYNPGENNTLDYLNIFNMMFKSFTLKN